MPENSAAFGHGHQSKRSEVALCLGPLDHSIAKIFTKFNDSIWLTQSETDALGHATH